ncbi:hypothetical protein ACRAWD_11665 [Caulobacter segnis]
MRGYWNKPEATAQTFIDGWVRTTGDLARLDAEGFCFIIDRAKDSADPGRREHLLHRGRELPLRPSGGDGRGPGGHSAQDRSARSRRPWSP